MARPLRVPFKREYNKYRAKTATYNGQKYHSKREAQYAAELDLLVKAGEVVGWEPQVSMPIVVNDTKVCDYRVDFVVMYPDGNNQYHEVKGYDTPMGKLKMKLFQACYPGSVLKVIR